MDIFKAEIKAAKETETVLSSLINDTTCQISPS